MMNSQQLREWLCSPTSRVLLLNGNGGNETFSPTTCLSAKLSETLTNLEPVITVHLFCSINTTPRNGDGHDPPAMIKLLIAQLLLCDLSWELTFPEQKDLNLDSLSKLFRGLLKHLPSVTFFFLVIDGITFYERLNRRSDFVKAMTELLNIMDDCENITMRMILTCHRDRRLAVPSKVDGDCQGWSGYGWDRSVSDVETLEKAVS